MSWFKRGLTKQESRSASGKLENLPSPEIQPHRNTDPQTCLEVFQNHWQQAWRVIGEEEGALKARYHTDEVETVVHNLEQMINLLSVEENQNDQPGPILQFLMCENVLEKFGYWCAFVTDHKEKLLCDQLKMFDHLISYSDQLILIHKRIIHPLMMLLSSCADHLKSKEVELHLSQVLHQICISISQQPATLNCFFSMEEEEKGPAEFLIFSLLIPYIHRDGLVGQQARDALLLIMALSAKYPHIGKYISNHSHLCPVLATGLSGLFSSLPRKIYFPSDSWYQLTSENCSKIPDLVMFLNSLEFCNAVLQIAHPLVRDQLVKYIYTGFLVPVLGAALHQELLGLPTPLLDSPMFANSREEVITATSYLDLFLRSITEPTLIRAFLKFILTEKYDEIIILDSLITRINSNSKLCLVSLSLFTTLVDLNCEDVMFQLVFKYLIPCTHVMISQRRAVKDVDIHSLIAEKVLSLQPNCCASVREHCKDDSNSSSSSHSSDIDHKPVKSRRTFARFLRKRSKMETEARNLSSSDLGSTLASSGDCGSKLNHFETNYLEYLLEARIKLRQCYRACRSWSMLYDGDQPPSSAIQSGIAGSEQRLLENIAHDFSCKQLSTDRDNSLKILFHGNSPTGSAHINPESKICENGMVHSTSKLSFEGVSEESGSSSSETLEVKVLSMLSRLRSCFDDVEMFMDLLTTLEIPVNEDESLEELMLFIDTLFSESAMAARPNFQSHRIMLSQDHLVSSDFDSQNALTNSSSTSALAGKYLTNFQDRFSSGSVMSQPDFANVQTACGDISHDVNNFDAVDVSSSSPVESSACKTLATLPLQTDQALSDLTLKEVQKQNIGDTLRLADFVKQRGLSTGALSYSGTGASKYISGPPNIGPFLSALLSKLESMLHNSLHINLLLTGLIARLAAYPQPLLRSFLLNHNLVFQPSVKSLVQVLSVVKQKLDNFSSLVPNFEFILLKAQQAMAVREEELRLQEMDERTTQLSSSSPQMRKQEQIIQKEKKRSTISDLFSRMSPTSDRSQKRSSLVSIPGGRGYHFINQRIVDEPSENPMESQKVKNAVYCAIVLDEFLKELAALAQEHSVLLIDEGYISS